MHTDDRGFTLIEILIVTVILGVLAALAIPKFAKSKEKAHLAAMTSDLRNLATGQEAYHSDQATYYDGAVAVRQARLRCLVRGLNNAFRRDGLRLGGGHEPHPDRQDLRHFYGWCCAAAACG